MYTTILGIESCNECLISKKIKAMPTGYLGGKKGFVVNR